jgi:hypothetical protein
MKRIIELEISLCNTVVARENASNTGIYEVLAVEPHLLIHPFDFIG